ncbi:RICIN domain-containing protein [Streptomyces sp. NPDC087901]|uniref:RICIN domain-containing protein n=1 Tax=Streptomyces sp. NPDC087901 TaxID=3365818 RepID=UPI00380AFA18
MAVAAGSAAPAGADVEDGDGDSGKPKKPFLAAAAMAGVVLAAVPLLIFATGASDDEHKKQKVVSVADADIPLDDTRVEEPPALYAPDKPKDESPTPKGGTKKPVEEKALGEKLVGTPTGEAKPVPTATQKPKPVVKKSAPVVASPVTYRIVGGDSGKCLSVDVVADGTPLYIWDCNSSRQQIWTFQKDGTVRLGGMCMNTASPEARAVVQLARCNGNVAQQFRLNADHELVAKISDYCVDAWYAKDANGTAVKVWGCSGDANQNWSRSKVPSAE